MEEVQITPEAQEELNNRVKACNEKLIPLLGEFKLGLGAVPFVTADGRIAARPQVFDDQKAGQEVAAPKEAATLAAKEEKPKIIDPT